MTMNSAIENLVLQQFQKRHLEEVEVSDIEQLAIKYPYYAPIQYLLAIKYKQMEALLYRLQLPKTAIFFSNPHWLNDLLQNGGENRETPATTEPQTEVIETENKELADEQASTITEEINPGEYPEEKNTPQEIRKENINPDPIPVEEHLPDEDLFKPKAEEEEEEEEGEENQPPSAVNATPEEKPEERITSSLSVLKSESATLPAIPLEPLFTIDYFASQGIRWSNEEGNDKLSKKLRSFTEWLKTMKRLHPEKLEQEMDKGRDAIIQDIAEHSNEADEVVTEAMAEVYARQGLNAKAIEVYQKLSLLNPNKRTYFAARISKLN